MSKLSVTFGHVNGLRKREGIPALPGQTTRLRQITLVLTAPTLGQRRRRLFLYMLETIML